MNICLKCKKNDKEVDFPVRNKDLCKKCRNLLATQKYKSTEKGINSQEKFLKSEKWKQILKKSKKKTDAAGKARKKYHENEEFRKNEILRRIIHHKKNPKIKKENEKRHSIKHPEKSKARNRLRMAVHRGTISKPICCDKCKIQAKRIEAHHHDYSKPFDVIWLCVECHKIEHGKIVGAI